MEVIFITREGYNLSGARIRCHGFAKELKKRGVDTEVFSFADNLGAKFAEKECEMSFVQKIRYNIQAFKYIINRVTKDDVIFLQRVNYHILAPFFACLMKKSKIVFDCDDWNIRENPVYHLGFYPSSKMEYFTRKIAKRADKCVAASRFLQNYIEKFNPNTFYIPTGVDTDVFKPNGKTNDGSKVTFSWIGTVYHKEMKENLEFIIGTFTALSEKYENVFLEIAGEGKYLEQIKLGPVRSDIKNRIKFYDWVHPDRMPEYLSHVDVGLLPLIQNTKFNKAKSPTKLFEYMAMAKPVICSNIGEAAEVIKDGVSGFLAGTKEEFICRMQQLVENPLLRGRVGQEARQAIDNSYSLNVLGEKLYNIIRTI